MVTNNWIDSVYTTHLVYPNLCELKDIIPKEERAIRIKFVPSSRQYAFRGNVVESWEQVGYNSEFEAAFGHGSESLDSGLDSFVPCNSEPSLTPPGSPEESSPIRPESRNNSPSFNDLSISESISWLTTEEEVIEINQEPDSACAGKVQGIPSPTSENFVNPNTED